MLLLHRPQFPIPAIFLLLLAAYLSPAALPPVRAATVTADGITASVETAARVHIGAPFRYRFALVYRPENVEPDFRSIARNIRFAPFEQVYSSHTANTRRKLGDGTTEYSLVYTIQGVNVVPHSDYPLADISIPYRDIATGRIRTLRLHPQPVTVAGYYPREVSGIPFRPLKGRVPDYRLAGQAALAVLALVCLLLAGGLIRRAVRRRDVTAASTADVLQEKFMSLRKTDLDNRQRLLAYERIFLSLLLHYGNLRARGFWSGRSAATAGFWRETGQHVRAFLAAAYTGAVPSGTEVADLEKSLQSVFEHTAPVVQVERERQRARLQGSAGERIARHSRSFTLGIAGLATAILLGWLAATPSLWLDLDVSVYNAWVSALPGRMFDPDRDRELGAVDVDMLKNITGSQHILGKLKVPRLLSACLYDYGTIVTRANVAIMLTAGEDEDEPPPPPSFELPIRLLQASVRYIPGDEDVRRNLELAVMLRAKTSTQETEKVQGDIGPPLPGFSRDLNEAAF